MQKYRFIIAYDISNDKIRTEFSKKLDTYGSRINYSIYEFLLDKKNYEKLKDEISAFYKRCVLGRYHLNGQSLKIIIIPICENCFKNKVAFGCDFLKENKHIIL